jgi:hypothetical protein
MAIRSLTRSGVAGGKYINFLAGNAPFLPDSDFLIQEQVLGTSAATVTFSSIPSTYKHLQVRYVAGTTDGTTSTQQIRLQFNGSAASAYTAHNLQGNGSSVSSNAFTPFLRTNILLDSAITGDGHGSGVFGAGIIDILDYGSTTKNTTVRALGGLTPNNYVHLTSGAWINTAAVTSLALTSSGTAFRIGTRFSLYGSNG